MHGILNKIINNKNNMRDKNIKFIFCLNGYRQKDL